MYPFIHIGHFFRRHLWHYALAGGGLRLMGSPSEFPPLADRRRRHRNRCSLHRGRRHRSETLACARRPAGADATSPGVALRPRRICLVRRARRRHSRARLAGARLRHRAAGHAGSLDRRRRDRLRRRPARLLHLRRRRLRHSDQTALGNGLSQRPGTDPARVACIPRPSTS